MFPGWLPLWIAIMADMGALIVVTLNGKRLQGRGLSPFGLPMPFSPVQIIPLELFMDLAASAFVAVGLHVPGSGGRLNLIPLPAGAVIVLISVAGVLMSLLKTRKYRRIHVLLGIREERNA